MDDNNHIIEENDEDSELCGSESQSDLDSAKTDSDKASDQNEET